MGRLPIHRALVVFVITVCCCCNAHSVSDKRTIPVTYFVDSQDGSDENDGLSEDTAWKSFTKIEQTELYPGDVLRFKRGSKFSGTLLISHSGNAENFITLTDYGDSSQPAPAFTNATFNPHAGEFGNCIRLAGSYILVDGLYFHNTVAELPQDAGGFTTMWELGAIYIQKNAKHCIVRNNELFDCGVGIKSYGEHAIIEHNYIHDCNRVLKEWGWGPIGIWLGGDFQEVRYNRIFNYRAVDPRITWGPDAYGGGADGGAMEIDDARYPKENISIHHNYTRDCQGFLEVTWKDVLQNPTYRNFKIHHNVSDDYQQFIALWRGANCNIENNTIIRRKVNVNDWGVFNITQHQARNYIRNNIVVVESDVVIFNVGKKGTAQPENIIDHNLYFAASGSLQIGKEGPGIGAVFSNPYLRNYTNASDAEDFMISKDSPAVDSGLSLDYESDFMETRIPQGAAADLGAFEYTD